MKVAELRVGNWYKSVKFGVPAQCDLSDLHELCVRSDGAYNDPPIDEMFEPIPLTEEWLNKFDFIKDDLLNRWIFRSNEYFYLDAEYSLWFEGSFTCIDIQYVHQLQNLNFVMNNEELTIE
jgi:hypothetical protein